MAAFWIIVRIVIFLAIVGPIVWWVVRRARDARQIPANSGDDRMLHQARSDGQAHGNSSSWGA